MHIGFLGAGSVASTLGGRLLALGHDVAYGVRRPSDDKYASLLESGARVESLARACETSEVVFLATPWDAAEQALAACGDLSGKVLVDCTNPLEPGLSGLTHGRDDSGGERVAAWAPGANVVKAFNTVGANIMAEPELEDRKAVMYACGDDEPSRRLVVGLSHDLGFETIDAGPLASARLLEPFALLWISSAYRFGLGRDFAFSLVRR